MNFPFDSAAMLAEIVVPMTEAQAIEVLNAAFSRETGYSSCAIYWTDDKTGKPIKTLVSVSIEGGNMSDGSTYMYAFVGEYRPRKDGKAEFIYK